MELPAEMWEGVFILSTGRKKCVFEENIYNSETVEEKLAISHVRKDHVFFPLKVCRSTDDLLSGLCFFSSAVSSDSVLCPLLIFHGKNTQPHPSTGCRGTSEQSMRVASVKEAAVGCWWCRWRWESHSESTIYPVQAAEENRGKVPHFHFSSHQLLKGCLPQQRSTMAAVTGWVGEC